MFPDSGPGATNWHSPRRNATHSFYQSCPSSGGFGGVADRNSFIAVELANFLSQGKLNKKTQPPRRMAVLVISIKRLLAENGVEAEELFAGELALVEF